MSNFLFVRPLGLQYIEEQKEGEGRQLKVDRGQLNGLLIIIAEHALQQYCCTSYNIV